MKFFSKFLICLGLIFLVSLPVISQTFASEGNITSVYKYAWSENVGWNNYRPTSAGATVTTQYLSGYIWCENIGWVHLGALPAPVLPATQWANTTKDDYGVNNDGSGNLSGYAWSENVGWINFDPTGSQVTLDANGIFSGYAWAENVGWINFNGQNTAAPIIPYYPQTASVIISGNTIDAKSNTNPFGVSVELLGPSGNILATEKIHGDGNYSIAGNYLPGNYTLRFSGAPYYKTTTQALTIVAGTDAYPAGTTLIDPFGIVYNSVTGEVIQGALVTLYTAGGLIYTGSPQINPQSSRVDGGYNYDVAPGTYSLGAKASGYKDYSGATFSVVADIVEWNIPMIPEYQDSSSILSISHTANKTSASTGDILTYTINIKNIAIRPADDVSSVSVTTSLPHGFKYAAGTTTVNGVLQADPVNKISPSWSVGAIAHDTTKTITYRVIIDPDAKTGKQKAYASCSGALPSGSSTSAGPSAAVVDIMEGLFCKKELVTGKVFNDLNNNSSQDVGEKGVPGVALIMEDGKTIVTDEDGRFSIPDVSLGTHILRVDQRMLPGGPLTKEAAAAGKWDYEKPEDRLKRLEDISKKVESAGQSVAITNATTSSLRGASRQIQSDEAGGLAARRLVSAPAYPINPNNPTNPINSIYSPNTTLPPSSLYATNPVDPINPANSLVDRRTLGNWIGDGLFGKNAPVLAEKPVNNPILQTLAYRPDIPRVSKFFRVYETQTTKVNIPINLLSEDDTTKQLKKDRRDNQFMLVALADGQVGYMAASGNLQNFKDGSNDGFANSFSEDGTVKAYLKGKIQGKYLLTARFDSSKENEDHLFEYINQEKYYPIYGDRSTLLNDADSPGKAYVRLDRADSYAMYGNYSTEEFTQTQLSSYARTLSGAKGHIETKDIITSEIEGAPNVKLDVFGSETRQDKEEDILAGRGVSGPYYTTQKPVMEYTEIIRIEVRDKSRPDTVLKTLSMVRDTDYEISYDSGTILFRKPIPTYDENNDPVFIVINYEYTPLSKISERYIMGARGEVIFDKFGPGSIMPKLKVGGQFISEQKNSESLRLGGVDATSEIFPGTTIGGEFAYSDNLIAKGGNAWRLEADSRLFKDMLHLQAYTTEIDPNFQNPINVSERGVQKYGVSAKLQATKDISIVVDQWKVRSMTELPFDSSISHSFDRDTKVDVYYEKGKYILGTGYELREFVDERGAVPNQTTNSIFLQGGFKFTDRFIASMQYKLSDENVEGVRKTQINTLSPRADFLIDKETSAYARQDIRNDRTYGSDRSYNQNNTVVGLMRQDERGGRNYVEYGFTGQEVDTVSVGNVGDVPLTDTLSLSTYNSNVLSKDKSEENVGYGAKWEILEDIFANFAVERTKTTGAVNYDSNAQSFTTEWRPKDGINTVGVKYENRYQLNTKEFNIDANARLALSESFFLISREQFQEARDKDEQQTNRLFQRMMGGIAYRPVDNDKLNALAKYDYSRDVNTDTAESRTDYQRQIASLEAIYDLTQKVELYGKYALKFVSEGTLAMNTESMTDLITSRFRYKFTDTFDVACLYHIIQNRNIATIKQGAQGEIGITLYGHMRLALGWSFIDYSDNDYSNEDYTATGPYARASFALLDPDLENIPGIDGFSKDRVDIIKEKMVNARVKDIPKDELGALNRKFNEAEALYKEGRFAEARTIYNEVNLRMTQIRFDVDDAVKMRLEKEEAAVDTMERAESLYKEGNLAEARVLYKQVCQK